MGEGGTGPQRCLGRYVLHEQIGAGGMGVVYRGHDQNLDRDVAIKVLPAGALGDEVARKRFRKEALALSRLNHPNIATIHDFDTIAGTNFLVMEFVPGTTLADRTANGPLAEKDILAVVAQLTQGLAAAHKHGVVHCDLKPANLRTTPEGILKILDFGLAQLIEAAGDSQATRSARETMLEGTVPYMAPEQARGEPVDARTDVYATGAVLYEMATGRPLFKGSSSAALLGAVLHQPIVPPHQLNSSISPELERIILKCLEKDPENRYQSVKELAIDLRRLMTPSAVAALPRGPRHKSRTAAVAIVIALAVLVAGIWMAKRGLGHDQPAASAPTAIHSLAVLPLEDFSTGGAQEYFAEGMTDELIATLAQIGDLRVISRTSVAQYKGTKKSLPEIARELKVDGIIEGSVQRVGDRVRIRAQLIRAADEQHLWTKDYEGVMRDVLTLESEVARAIAGQIEAKLTQDEGRRLTMLRPVSPEAHEAYLRGSYYLDRGELAKSIEYFDQAVTADSSYAPAYARRALAYYFQGFFSMLPPAEAFGRMRESAQLALRNDDGLAEAHGALALVKLHYEWDWDGADREFRAALKLNPNSADIHHDYAHYLNTIGRLEESAAETRAALERDPAGVMLMSCVCWHHYSARQYDQALAQSGQALQMEPNFNWTHTIRGWAYEQKGQFKDAIAEFKLALTMGMGGESKPMAMEKPKAMDMSMPPASKGMGSGGMNADQMGMEKPMQPMLAKKPAVMQEKMQGMPFILAALGHAYALSGRRMEAQRVLAQLLRERDQSYVSAFDLAVLYTGLGEKQQALEWLEKSYQERSAFLIYMTWDPRLDSLRKEPRFQQIIQRVGFPTTVLR